MLLLVLVGWVRVRGRAARRRRRAEVGCMVGVLGGVVVVVVKCCDLGIGGVGVRYVKGSGREKNNL